MIICGVAFTPASDAQQTVGESIEARKRASFAQLQQSDPEVAGGCLLVQTAYENFPSRIQQAIFNGELSTDPLFWHDYLKRSGMTETQIASVTAKANTMAENVSSVPDAQLSQLSGQFRSRLEQCAQAQEMLEANRCSPDDAKQAPPSVLIPIAATKMVRICREMTARDSRNEPASWVQESPDALADFNARKNRNTRKVSWYDELLAQQPVPQCPTDYEGGVCVIGCSGGSQAFGEAYQQVQDAYEQFQTSTRDGLGDFENMAARNKQNRVQWSLDCEDFEMVANYPSSDP